MANTSQDFVHSPDVARKLHPASLGSHLLIPQPSGPPRAFSSSCSSPKTSSKSSSYRRRSPHPHPSLSRADTANSSSSGSELSACASSFTSIDINIDTSLGSSLAHSRSDSKSDSGSLSSAVHSQLQGNIDKPSHASIQTLSKARPLDVTDHYLLQGERPLGHRSHFESSQAYDKQVLSKIGGPTSLSRSPSDISSAKDDTNSPEDSVRSPSSQFIPSAWPEERRTSFIAPFASNRGPTAPTNGPNTYQILNMVPPHRQLNHVVDGLRSNAPPHDQPAFNDGDFRFDDTMIHDSRSPERSPRSDTQSQSSSTGQKRRAMSPPAETLDPSLRPLHNAHQRHTLQPKPASPQDMRPHQERIPNSTANLAPLGSTGVVSQSSTFPVYPPPTGGSFPSDGNSSTWPAEQVQESSTTMTMSQPASAKMINPPPIYIGQDPSRSVPPMPHRRHGSSGMARAGGLYICECCPKKPKKFESGEELRAHEAEKQYVCQYCHNRFKNKNEAERHQNSLHLRRHSWSCAALIRIESAFHPTHTSNAAAAAAAAATSPTSPAYPPQAATDTCGYCGQEFPNPADWTVRMEHLSHAHKFGECNQGKKFFRADHFRQHLKHSHAGTSGRWTNQLETACMREEPPPQPMQAASVPVPPAGDASQVMQALPAASGPRNAAAATMANMVPSSVVTLPPKKSDDARADGH